MSAARRLAYAASRQFRQLTTPSLDLPDSDFAREYRDKGYAVLRGIIPVELVEALKAAVDVEVYNTTEPLLRHVSRQQESHVFVESPDGKPIIRNAILDPHCAEPLPGFRSRFADAILTDKISDLLESVDGSRDHVLLQTILFFLPAATSTHVDGWGMDTEPCGYAHTMWMPLEPVTAKNGPVAVYDWPVGKRLPLDLSTTSYEAYHEALFPQLCRPAIPDLNPGDLVLFSSTTPHGTMPSVHPHISRMSMQIRAVPSNLKVGAWPAIFRRSPCSGRKSSEDGRWSILCR